MRNKSNPLTVALVGAFFLVSSVVCLATSLVGQSELRRWEAAPSIQELGQLQRVGEGNDVVIVGTLAPDTPVVEEGLALYERWEHEVKYKDGDRKSRWRHNYDYDHKPTFKLLFNDQRINAQSNFVTFHNPREIMLDRDLKLKGFAPGDALTILGSVVAPAEPATVEAEYICGGEREACLSHFSRSSVGPAIGAALMLLIGGGLLWLALRQFKRGNS